MKISNVQQWYRPAVNLQETELILRTHLVEVAEVNTTPNLAVLIIYWHNVREPGRVLCRFYGDNI